jgi:rare lipoprotein A (peptidoglycan hydrolase)
MTAPLRAGFGFRRGGRRQPRVSRLAQRELGLAAVALLGAVVAVAVSARRNETAPIRLPEAVGSYVAFAGSSGLQAIGRRTTCGGTIEAGTMGVAQPTLPCGTRIYVTYRGKRVLTEVIDRGPREPGRQFDLTDALARRLGLTGVQEVEWSYVRVG